MKRVNMILSDGNLRDLKMLMLKNGKKTYDEMICELITFYESNQVSVFELRKKVSKTE